MFIQILPYNPRLQKHRNNVKCALDSATKGNALPLSMFQINMNLNIKITMKSLLSLIRLAMI